MNKYLDMFLTFFKIGATTFGGGYAMIAQIKEYIVDKKQWIDNDELLEICAIAESTPGPLAINLATFIGYRKGKIFGSTVSTLGVVLPSFIFIYILSFFLSYFFQNEYVQYAFIGIKCGVAFLIGKTAIEMIAKMEKSWWQILLFISITFCMVFFEIFKVSFSSIYYIIIGSILGIIILSIPKKEETK